MATKSSLFDRFKSAPHVGPRTLWGYLCKRSPQRIVVGGQRAGQQSQSLAERILLVFWRICIDFRLAGQPTAFIWSRQASPQPSFFRTILESRHFLATIVKIHKKSGPRFFDEKIFQLDPTRKTSFDHRSHKTHRHNSTLGSLERYPTPSDNWPHCFANQKQNKKNWWGENVAVKAYKKPSMKTFFFGAVTLRP